MIRKSAFVCLLVAVAAPALAGQLSGAVYTTIKDGTQVNENIFENKEDVWFAGGPGWNAPPTASGLPPGNYYFMVTDPSGKTLLSDDPIECREVIVNEAGVISGVVDIEPVKYQGKWYQEHAVWDAETIPHNDVGAVTVQLMPYSNTPNKGGVYKLWLTPKDAYVPGGGPGTIFGFVPAWCKTDNYKVLRNGGGNGPGTYTFYLNVQKFNDKNVSSAWDVGEEEVTGWHISITYPNGVTNNYWTPVELEITREETAGAFTVAADEDTPTGTVQTVSILDDVQKSTYPNATPEVTVEFAATSNGETHNVIYGNVGLGTIKATKFYDRNGDGLWDEGEPPVKGWRMTLTGTDVLGGTVENTIPTDANGDAVFDGLLPGTYNVSELPMPSTDMSCCEWQATTATDKDVVIESTVTGDTIAGTVDTATFGNVCIGTADFDTKGYWHNKNGLDELDQADIDEANELPPYAAPSSYFGAGDEPFDGLFSDETTPVAAAQGPAGDEIAAAGTALAEVSHFLVDPNAGGDPREQLAQQLLAFFFNTHHRLDDPGAAIDIGGGVYVSAADLVDQAIAAWLGDDQDAQNTMEALLDELNNNNAVPYVHYWPCAVVY